MSFDHLTLFKIIQDLEGDPPRLLVSHMNYSMGSLHSQLNVWHLITLQKQYRQILKRSHRLFVLNPYPNQVMYGGHCPGVPAFSLDHAHTQAKGHFNAEQGRKLGTFLCEELLIHSSLRSAHCIKFTNINTCTSITVPMSQMCQYHHMGHYHLRVSLIQSGPHCQESKYLSIDRREMVGGNPCKIPWNGREGKVGGTPSRIAAKVGSIQLIDVGLDW